jgi:hypothetical protein
MATAAYNLKKLMSFNRIKSAASAIKNIAVDVKTSVLSQILLLFGSTLVCFNYRTIKNGNLNFIVYL